MPPCGLNRAITISRPIARVDISYRTRLACLPSRLPSKRGAMTTKQKLLLGAAMGTAIGFAIYEARLASSLRAELSQWERDSERHPVAFQTNLQERVEVLEARTSDLATEL